MMQPLDQLLHDLVCAIVAHPDAVSVEMHETDQRIMLVLRVHPADRGGVIGLRGCNAESLRKVLAAIGGKIGKRVQLTIPDAEEPRDTK